MLSCHSEPPAPEIDIAEPFRRPSRVMRQPDHENQHAPLSYHGAWRIVWLVFLLVIIWLILRSLEPVILLFALVFLLAMVLNPIVVWLQKHPHSAFRKRDSPDTWLNCNQWRTIVIFAIPPLARQTQELTHSAPRVWQGIRYPHRIAYRKTIRQFAKRCQAVMK